MIKTGNCLSMVEEKGKKIKKWFDHYSHFLHLLSSKLQVRRQPVFIFTVALSLMQQLTAPFFNCTKTTSDLVTTTYTCACCWNYAPNMRSSHVARAVHNRVMATWQKKKTYWVADMIIPKTHLCLEHRGLCVEPLWEWRAEAMCSWFHRQQVCHCGSYE